MSKLKSKLASPALQEVNNWSQLPTFRGVFLIPWTLSPSPVVCGHICVYRSSGAICLVFFVCVHMCIQVLRNHPLCILRPGVCWPGWCQGSVCLPWSRARITHSQPQVQLFPPVLGLELWSSRLYGKCFINKAIAPARYTPIGI